ncbi:hypothetical protein UB43_13160 [Pseudomonas sp. 21]|uniref:hypothetical protein n=1 Tax=unclassified Pseudomonas TaxID=196821 RepID=UPI0005EB1086|nr:MULTISPECIES: hypothetical protein [unclassified Pseudomonas]KJJ99931.1 hypothetical protein UB43_13160 [Pseudomonas sp. 21]MBV7585756.1 hypothetical protein [Pseudomonas sp. PDM33]
MNRDPHEQELLEHYRRHSDEQPSAQLDARILAAARAAVQQKPPSFAQRLHQWLLGAGSRQRWGVAVAGLATLGIGLSLTLRTFEEAPERFDAPVSPAMMRAPAPAPAMAPPAAPAVAEPRMAAPQMDSAAAGATIQELAKPAPMSKKMAAAAARDEVRESADAQARSGVSAEGKLQAFAEEADEPRTSLLHLRDLQDSGQKAEAERVRESLRQRFPDLDIDRALKELPDNP